jgi:hypothetical protein
MKTIPLILCLLLSGSVLFGQNPKLPSDSENQEPPAPSSCEAFVAASYDREAATLILRLETCGITEFYNCFQVCTVSDFGNRDPHHESQLHNQKSQLVVGSLHGSIHYQDFFQGCLIPDGIRVASLHLNPGIYYVRLNGVPGQENLYSKFLVK